mgnify:CR=1 FL=1
MPGLEPQELYDSDSDDDDDDDVPPLETMQHEEYDSSDSELDSGSVPDLLSDSDDESKIPELVDHPFDLDSDKSEDEWDSDDSEGKPDKDDVVNSGVIVDSREKPEDLRNSEVSNNSEEDSEAPTLVESGDSIASESKASEGSNFDFEFTGEEYREALRIICNLNDIFIIPELEGVNPSDEKKVHIVSAPKIASVTPRNW